LPYDGTIEGKCDEIPFLAIIEKIWPLNFRYVGNTSWDRGCVNEILMGIKMR